MSHPGRAPLSAVLITRNAAGLLEPCLDSLAFVDEIVVVDSSSTDGTAELAQKRGARVVQKEWLGFGRQKQFAVEQARNDWVLCLDADERVSPRLARSIEAALAAPESPVYRMARRNRFLVHKEFQLRYDATSEQIRLLLKKCEELFFANEYVTEEGLPVRYLGPGSDGHMMELFFYINVSENNDYLRVQQDLMLQMADLVAELGLYYIIPSQTMLPAVDQRGADAGTHAAPQAPIKA